jgi:hypothetical protein
MIKRVLDTVSYDRVYQWFDEIRGEVYSIEHYIALYDRVYEWLDEIRGEVYSI